MIAWDAGEYPASPTPANARHTASWPNPRTNPAAEVTRLQNPRLQAMTTRRDFRSASTPRGIEQSDSRMMYADPSQPSCWSVTWSSCLTVSKTAKTTLRSRLLRRLISVRSPRTYPAYVLEPTTDDAPLLRASASGGLRAGIARLPGLLVGFHQIRHHRGPAVIEALQRPRLPLGQRVRGEERQGDRVVRVADHRAGQLVGVDLAPAHG